MIDAHAPGSTRRLTLGADDRQGRRVGLVDEITDRTWIVVDAVDDRVHHAEPGRLSPAEVPARGMLVALAVDSLEGKPLPHPKLQVLSAIEVQLA